MLLDHSISQLKLLSDAGNRLRARDGLLTLGVTQAAVASCMAKNGNQIANKVRRSLTKQAE